MFYVYWGKFWSDNRFLNWKISISIKFKMCISQLIAKILHKQQIKSNQTLFDKGIIKSDIIFYQKILNYFNDLQNWNFSFLWITWTETMEMKLNQTFFHWTYSNLTPYLFLLKSIKVFQWLSKSKFLSFMTKVNTKKWKWNKIRHFLMGDIQIWHIFFYQKIFKYFSDLQNQNFSALWLKYGNETKLDIFSLGIFKSFSFFVGYRILKLQWHFVINIFQFHWKSEHKQSKVKKKIKQDICESDSIFPYLQRGTLFKWFFKIYLLVSFTSKMTDNSYKEKNLLRWILACKCYRKLNTFSREKFMTRS